MRETRTKIRRALPVAAIVLCAIAGPVPYGAPQEEALVGELDTGAACFWWAPMRTGGASGSKHPGWRPSRSWSP